MEYLYYYIAIIVIISLEILKKLGSREDDIYFAPSLRNASGVWQSHSFDIKINI